MSNTMAMAQGTYEYECMRAELLGIDKPDLETFEANRALQDEAIRQEMEAAELANLESEEDILKNTAGKLDELNSILSITQQKINKFKVACGSLTNLLKIKSGHGDSTESLSGKNGAAPGSSHNADAATGKKANINDALDDLHDMSELEKTPIVSKQAAKEISRKMSFQLDKLDTLLQKTEKAQCSMAKQNKEMKSFLK